MLVTLFVSYYGVLRSKWALSPALPHRVNLTGKILQSTDASNIKFLAIWVELNVQVWVWIWNPPGHGTGGVRSFVVEVMFQIGSPYLQYTASLNSSLLLYYYQNNDNVLLHCTPDDKFWNNVSTSKACLIAAVADHSMCSWKSAATIPVNAGWSILISTVKSICIWCNCNGRQIFLSIK